MITPNVFAASYQVTVQCNSSVVSANSNTTCTIKGTTTGQVSSIHAEVRLGNNLTLNSVTKSSIWEGSVENGVIDFYTESNKTGTFDIATVTLNVGSLNDHSSFISLSNIVVSDENFLEYSVNFTSYEIRTLSINNSLKSLSLTNGSISFNPSTTAYDVVIDNSETTISAVANDSKARISGTGAKTLAYGLNTFEVVVVSESGSSKTYTIRVTRPNKTPVQPSGPTTTKSNNAFLSKIQLSEGTISFDKNTLQYKLDVENSVTKINVTATAEDKKATVKVNNVDKLVVGENTITIDVTAEDGTKKQYTILVNRKAEKEVATVAVTNDLKNITIDDYDFKFDPSITEYTLKIKDESKLKINYSKEDSALVVSINGNNDLKNGSIITIEVRAMDGTIKNYTIKIEKDENSDDEDDSSPEDEEYNEKNQTTDVVSSSAEEKNSYWIYDIVGCILMAIELIVIIILLKKKKNK